MAGSSAAGDTVSPSSNGNGLVLYLNPSSFYSQKVILALHEKRLKYKPHLVNLFAGDHLQPWFMKLNAKGQVPVLQDGIKVIPDSASIIEYLEDNFYNGNFPKLHPSKGTEFFQKVKRFVDLLDQVRVPLLTFGTLCFPHLTSGSTISDAERKARLGMLDIDQILAAKQKEFPEISENLQQKSHVLRILFDSAQNLDDVQKEIASTDAILDKVENELASHNEDQNQWWLCCDQFTVADVILAILLNRFDVLGLTCHFVDNSKRPCLNLYKDRIQQRPAYQAFLKDVQRLQRSLHPSSLNKPLLTALGTVTVIGLVAAAAIIYKRVKNV